MRKILARLHPFLRLTADSDGEAPGVTVIGPSDKPGNYGCDIVLNIETEDGNEWAIPIRDVVEAANAADELRALREYNARREAEDAAIDIDVERIMASLPPLKPGKASIALGKLRTALGMETGAIGKVVEAAADELWRLRADLSDADMALAKIDSGFPDYREIASKYFRGREAAEAGGGDGSE